MPAEGDAGGTAQRGPKLRRHRLPRSRLEPPEGAVEAGREMVRAVTSQPRRRAAASIRRQSASHRAQSSASTASPSWQA